VYTGVPQTAQKAAPGGNSEPHLWQYFAVPDTKSEEKLVQYRVMEIENRDQLRPTGERV
jgi:hypothetical protein